MDEVRSREPSVQISATGVGREATTVACCARSVAGSLAFPPCESKMNSKLATKSTFLGMPCKSVRSMCSMSKH
eukprot:6491044-Amphidinium_carterae.4